MTSISNVTTPSAYFQPTNSSTDSTSKDGAKTSHATTGPAKSTSSSTSSASSSSSSTSTESASTENADGTYGPDHTAAPPANTPTAERVAEAKQLSGSTNTNTSNTSSGIDILA